MVNPNIHLIVIHCISYKTKQQNFFLRRRVKVCINLFRWTHSRPWFFLYFSPGNTGTVWSCRCIVAFVSSRCLKKKLCAESFAVINWLEVVDDEADWLLRCSWRTGTGWPPPVARSSRELLPLSLCLPAACSLHIWQRRVNHRIKETNWHTTISPSCLLSLCEISLPASSEAWVPGVMRTSIWNRKSHSTKTKNWHKHTEILHFTTWCVAHVNICASDVPWTCLEGNVAASLWSTDRWVSPCCSGGWWAWTQHSQCSLHR